MHKRLGARLPLRWGCNYVPEGGRIVRKALVGAIVVAVLMPIGGAVASSGAKATDEPEGCQAFNPGQPTCKFTATIDSESPVSGATGSGSWVVTVKRVGEKKPIVLKPADPYGGVVEFAYQQGDKVTAKALSPGTMMTAGSVQP